MRPRKTPASAPIVAAHWASSRPLAARRGCTGENSVFQLVQSGGTLIECQIQHHEGQKLCVKFQVDWSNEEFGQFSCLTVSLAASLAAGSSSLIVAAAQALTNFLLWSIIAFTNKLDTDEVPVADKSSFAADKSSFSTVPPNSAKDVKATLLQRDNHGFGVSLFDHFLNKGKAILLH
ncbi:hypothetical protein LguiB_006188 [Lonicera macranthoides]